MSGDPNPSGAHLSTKPRTEKSQNGATRGGARKRNATGPGPQCVRSRGPLRAPSPARCSRLGASCFSRARRARACSPPSPLLPLRRRRPAPSSPRSSSGSACAQVERTPPLPTRAARARWRLAMLQRLCENVSIATAVRDGLLDPHIEPRSRNVINREGREQAHFCVRERSGLLAEPSLGKLSRSRLC